jgi:micrococcal nuclease
MTRSVLVLRQTLKRAICALATMHVVAVGAVEISGIVTEVRDGDSVTLVNRQATYKIRLADIDAPEWKQKYGNDSRASLFHTCGLKRATAETIGEDRFGRTLAHLTCAGVDANRRQVERGWAWVFRQFAPKESPLYAVEQVARKAKRGVWQDDEPVPPWEWRRAQGAAEVGAR